MNLYICDIYVHPENELVNLRYMCALVKFMIGNRVVFLVHVATFKCFGMSDFTVLDSLR